MFRNRKKIPPYDRTGKEPIIRSSICTGEKTAGYRELATGRFVEVMCIRNDKDLQQFLSMYGFRKEELKYEY